MASLIQVFNSRTNILAILGTLGYKLDDYLAFSINEVDSMHRNGQLDMLIPHTDEKRKVYIKYLKQLRPANLDPILEELFVTDNVLEKSTGTLIIVVDDEPNESIMNKVKYVYDRDGIFVVIHNIKRLQYNLLDHVLVPTTVLLTDDETAAMMLKHNIKNLTQIPEISRFDPLALAICMRPRQVCKIIRSSVTALTNEYYRVCV